MNDLYTCFCCGYKTLSQPAGGTYAICPICFWEDDAIQLQDPDFAGGANTPSLRQAQKNYIAFGACDKESIQHVRKPNVTDQKDTHFQPIEPI